MAKRVEIAADIKKEFGSMLNLTEVGEYLGFCYRKTKKFLADVPYYDTGKDKNILPLI